MPRIRTIKPEVRSSPTVNRWPREVRLAWVYLWPYLDDEGIGRDNTRLIVAECFPLDRDITDRRMDSWLALMAEGPDAPLCRYEVAGGRYLHAVNWTAHQRINRPQPSRLPACPIHSTRSDACSEPRSESFSEPLSEPLSERAVNSSLGKGKEGKGREGTIAPDNTGAVNDSVNRSVNGHRPSPRPPDPLWDALMAVCHIDTTAIPPSARGAYNHAVKELRDLGATPPDIVRRGATYRQKWPQTTLTPTALAKHWAELTPTPAGRGGSPWNN